MNSKYKNYIIGGIILSIFVTLFGVNYYRKTNNIQENTPIAFTGNQNSSSTSGTTQSNSLNIDVPTVPETGVIKGVVELGASGFNSFVVKTDKQGNYKVTSKEFGDSLAYEGMANPDEVKSTVKKYIAKMFNKGVANNNVHFVISSGALKEPKTLTIANNMRAAGFVVNEVTADQEGKWALAAAMNPLYRGKAFVVDVGSGNTKISWFENGVAKTIEASGSKYFANGISDVDAFAEVSGKAEKVPAELRKICFVIGGVPNTLAKKSNNAGGRYIQLNNLNSYTAGDDKKLASGLNILKAIQKTTNTEFVFDDEANFSIGFLISLKN